MRIYSIYDKKALVYGPLMVFPKDVFAIRAVSMEVASARGPVANYPHDFCLVCLGEYEEATGKITTLDVPENVFELANAVRKENEA